ncbi:hypothetical protein M1615_00810 [Patescibacteria group bacterium]|nr:hypothetical protein [Patescibacteria group bacterium]MCL5010360.1 hypothetical protein [Patescibacteria group bacterium]
MPNPLHDSQGRFSKKTQKQGSPGIAQLFKTSDSSDDTTLVDVKITNPLHRITQILEQIKNRQGIPVSLHFTIPLLALPLVLFTVFQLGRAQTDCTPYFTSHVGILKSFKVLVPKQDSSISWQSLLAFLPVMPRPQSRNELVARDWTLLLEENGDTVTVVKNPGLDVTSYENKRVIINGNFSACTHAIALDAPQNILPR